MRKRQITRSLWLWAALCLTACTPKALVATPALTAIAFATFTESPAATATRPPAATQSQTPSRTPAPTTTLFAERVSTRPPGTLTPTPVFPTVPPRPIGLRQWTRGKNMPTQRLEMASAEVDGPIYVAACRNQSRVSLRL